MKGPEFLKYVNPVLTTLQENGGAGDSSDVIEQVIDKLGITEAELEETTANGQSRFATKFNGQDFIYLKRGSLTMHNVEFGV